MSWHEKRESNGKRKEKNVEGNEHSFSAFLNCGIIFASMTCDVYPLTQRVLIFFNLTFLSMLKFTCELNFLIFLVIFLV
jgi:hypothetical protein